MKRFLTFMLLGIISFYVAEAQTVRYKVKKDDPKDFKNFMLSIDPLMMDCYFTNITAGVAVRADYMLGKVLDVSAQYRKPYFDMNKMMIDQDAATSYVGKNGINPMSYLEATAQLHFIDKIKPTNHRVVFYKSTSTSGNYQTTTTKFVDIPGHVRKIKSLRGGVIWHNTSVDFDGIFGEEGEWFGKTEGDTTTVYFGEGGTMMRSMVFYAGLSGQTIANFKVLTDKYGMKYITPWNNFYVDVMFAPVLNFADVIASANNAVYSVENVSINRIGWRLGYVVKNHKGPGLSMAMNLGARPGINGAGGIMSPRLFFDVNMGVGIPNNFSFKAKKKS